MFDRRLFLALFLIIVVTTATPAGASPPSPWAPGVPGESNPKVDYSISQVSIPAAMNQTDLYGYMLDDGITKAWLDLTQSGTEVVFSSQNEDDEAVGPFSLGFNFPFYENKYGEIYISTNGLLTFKEGSSSYVNSLVPRDTDPNNFITPFWDDLILLVDNDSKPVSRVYYKTGTNSNGKYFAVEWFQIARLSGSQDKLTFEAILYENGDIVFQYNELNGIIDQATVGIEDEHGVDGLLYLHNAPGLSVTKAIKFIRPAVADWRVKVFPVYRSSFAIKHEAKLTFTVRNTGNQSGSDVFDLSVSSLSPGWSLTLFTGDGKTPLIDSDSDGVVDTGSLSPGMDFPVTVKAVSPDSAMVGDYIAPILTISSSRSSNKTASIQLQIAVPAPFAQASLDPVVGPSLSLIWKENLYGNNVNQGQQFTGSNLSVIAMLDNKYFYTWEHNLSTKENDKTRTWTNLEYMILNQFGFVLKPISSIADNYSAQFEPADRFLSLASAPDGSIGAIWVRTLTDDSIKKNNQNVYFCVLNSSGQITVAPINLTKNNLWRGTEDYDIPNFIVPRIVVSDDNHFVLAWGDERNHPSGSSSDLFVMVVNPDGSTRTPVTAMTASVAGSTRYSGPALVAMPGNRVLMGYVIQDPGNPQDPLDDTNTTAYLVLDSEGNVIKNQSVISGSSGSTPDGTLLWDGLNVVLGWNVPASYQVEYVLIDTSSLAINGSLISLSTPKGRIPSSVSVTSDEQGHAILTWGDGEQSDYLCYLLVDSDGSVAIPPMVFTYGLGSNPLINTNSYGLGNAPYDGSWQVQLPYLQR